MSCRRLRILVSALMIAGLVVTAGGVTPAAAEDPPVFVTTWGTHGSGDGQFNSITGIAVDKNGDVYATDASDPRWDELPNSRVQKFSADGQFLTQWGAQGSGDGRFSFPGGVAVATNGDVYVVDYRGGRVQKFSADGQFLTQWGAAGSRDGQFKGPDGVAVATNGDVYVIEYHGRRVQKFSADGRFLTKWGAPGSADGQFDGPRGVAVDATGSVYVTDAHDRVQKFSADGQFLATWGSTGSGDGQFDGPDGVAVDTNGDVYVVDSHNDRVQKFTADGQFLTQWGSQGSGDGQFDGPMGVAVDATGSVYVTDAHDRVQKFTPSAGPPVVPTPSSQVKGTLSTGAPVELAGGTATPGQETNLKETSSDPLIDGFEISVPAGAYTEPTTFKVTATPIMASTFGPLVTPVSHLFTIENGGGYAAVPMSLRIPAAIPADAVAGAFFYDPASGSLEGVPVVARDEQSMTLLTRHFSSIFLSIAEAGLPDTIDSGFVPALDAWQIPNRGAYPVPDGYCSGAATTAMWYFLEQHRAAGASHLFGLYDNNGSTKTPPFWEDDAHAIRLAATVQAKTDWDSLAASFFWRQAWIAGALAYDAFRYAMAVTGEPQLVFVKRPGAAHAMIVYKVDPGHLWIADPNFPGEARSTTFDWETRTLAPYVGTGTWPTLMYAAKSAIVPWSDLATAWGEFEDGTIGNDIFPKVEFFVLHPGEDPDQEPLVSGYETDQASITLRGSSAVDTTMTIYRGDQLTVSGGVGDDTIVPLAVGENEIGILSEAPNISSPAAWYEWAQFKRFTIVRVGPAPSPPNDFVEIRIEGVAPVGQDEYATTCPAEFWLIFYRYGGDRPPTGFAHLQASCTDTDYMALSAKGTFDGQTFVLSEGQYTYTGTFDGSTVTIIGGPQHATFEFQVPPPPPTPEPSPSAEAP